jgi:hypothetical protein
MEDQSKKQKMASFATSDRVEGAIEILKNERTKISSIVADTEYKTLLNALILETEASFINRFIQAIDKIKKEGIS